MTLNLTLDRWQTVPSIETLRSLYDSSAPQWHDNLARLGQLHSYQLLFESQAVRNHLSQIDQRSQILDCGVGTGAFSLALLESINRPAKVSGVDISHPMLSRAQQILEHRCTALNLRRGDIRHLPFADASFDAVIFAHVLEHMAEPVETLREMVRVLKPGAPLIGSVTRRGAGQVLMSLYWRNRGYTSGHLNAFLQTVGLEAVRSFDYGTGWSRWMCIATTGIKPTTTIKRYSN